MEISTTTPEPNVLVLSDVADVKEWLSPCLESLRGHSSPHCFKFITHASGEVKMYYKRWSSNPWCTDEEAVVLLKVCSY